MPLFLSVSIQMGFNVPRPRPIHPWEIDVKKIQRKLAFFSVQLGDKFVNARLELKARHIDKLPLSGILQKK